MSNLRSMMRPSSQIGILFDWDGVILDSSAAHEESWERLAREENLDLPEGHFRRGFGMKNEKIIPGLLNWTQDRAEIVRLSLRKEALYREIVAEKGIIPLPGVLSFLHQVREAGIPCAIGSSTHRENIDLSLRIMGLTSYFKGIVTAENVTHGKPDPEVFLTAAASLGLAPASCVVFEDALVGLAAGKAAGCRVIAVAGTHPAEDLKTAGPDKIVARLDELSPGDLHALFC